MNTFYANPPPLNTAPFGSAVEDVMSRPEVIRSVGDANTFYAGWDDDSIWQWWADLKRDKGTEDPTPSGSRPALKDQNINEPLIPLIPSLSMRKTLITVALIIGGAYFVNRMI